MNAERIIMLITKRESKCITKMTYKVKAGLIRRQHLVYVAMICTGIFLIIMSQLVDQRLLSEGIAFLIVGFVGIVMSWTTFDIGESIKEAVYQVGVENKELLNQMSARTDVLLNKMVETQKTIAEGTQKTITETQKRSEELQKAIIEMQKSSEETQKEIAKETQKTLLEMRKASEETQKASEERQKASEETQKALLETQKALLEMQKASEERQQDMGNTLTDIKRKLDA